jgi:SAM-dependent methyltransferase
MKPGSQQQYWNRKYARQAGREQRSRVNRPDSSAGPGDAGLKGILREFARPYHRYVLWKQLYPRFLPDTPGAKVLEVGCAPGYHLCKLARRFGYEPWGVDYAVAGVELTRKALQAEGFDPSHIIHADLFNEEFQRRYRCTFDIVFSRGFIEHFTDPHYAVRAHLNLLKEEGCLHVSIPNLRGIYLPWTATVERQFLSIHNTGIMRGDAFQRLFADDDLSTSFCGYYGAFTLHMLEAHRGTPARRLLDLGKKLQPALDILWRIVLRGRAGDCSMWSPYLAYFGRKMRSTVSRPKSEA